MVWLRRSVSSTERRSHRPFMLKTAFLIFLALSISIVGGGASLWYALRMQEGVGAVTIDGWTAFPEIGTPGADPYSKARVAREGLLSLGRAEGLSFSTQRDSMGDVLDRECQYRVEGSVPSSRLWTLHATDRAGSLITAGTLRAPALHSGELLRMPDNSFSISVGAQPRPGNWLALSGTGPMVLVLTLYDTTIASSTGLTNISLPQIVRVGCDA